MTSVQRKMKEEIKWEKKYMIRTGRDAERKKREWEEDEQVRNVNLTSAKREMKEDWKKKYVKRTERKAEKKRNGEKRVNNVKLTSVQREIKEEGT